MELSILANVALGVILIGGGTFAFARRISPSERKHVLGFGAYMSLVMILGVVVAVWSFQERENRYHQEIETLNARLMHLEGALNNQLLEKADLTATLYTLRSKIEEN